LNFPNKALPFAPVAVISGEKSPSQDELERELVAIFSDLADLFGNPPSHGAIYGLLFAAEDPLSMEEIVSRLQISKGSASQGLRHLEEFGAITRSRGDGDRTYRYAARLELKPLLSGFLKTRLVPRLAANADRLTRLQSLLSELPQSVRPTAEHRLDRITKWHKRATTFLPLAQRLLQGD
jgi:DNA-binding transcriptional regulator GbsR (MarR family)